MKYSKNIGSYIPDQFNKGVPLTYRLFGLVVPKKIGEWNRLYSRLFMALMKKEDMYYSVPKDNVIRVNQPVIYKENLLPSKLVHHFIDEANVHAIAKFCMCRTKMKCKNYPKTFGCLLMGKGVADVSPKLVDHVTREEAHQYAEKVREQGLVHMIGRTYADTLGFRWGKDAGKYHKKFMIVCNCCSCCCLTRIYPYATQAMKDMIKKIPGVLVQIKETCVGCSTCYNAKVCMFDAIRIKNGKANKTEDCVGCGRCVEVCPENAIEVTINKDSIITAVDHLSKLVDLKD